jgi:hypothetical protein
MLHLSGHNRGMAGHDNHAEPGRPSIGFWRHLRPIVSVLILVHLTVVIATPLALVTPRSRLAERIVLWAAPYVQAGNISHGYAFFAPDPGPSHLIHYELEFSDGRVVKGKLPDLDKHWPRLLYHRHFMLSEQLAAMARRADPPPQPEMPADLAYVEAWKDEYANWKIAREQFMQRARSYAVHLLKSRGAERVHLQLIRHEIPAAVDVRRGRKLTDEGLYRPFSREPVVTVTAKELR